MNNNKKVKAGNRGNWARPPRFREAVRGSMRQLLTRPEFRIENPGISADLLGVLPPLPSSPAAPGATQIQTPEAPVKPVDTENKKLLQLMADVATGLWRMKRKMPTDGSETAEKLRAFFRHFESTRELLADAGVEVRDPAGEKFVNGMALRVIAFQPKEGVQIETIDETIRPSIFFKKNLIQMGEVIVATPMEAGRV